MEQMGTVEQMFLELIRTRVCVYILIKNCSSVPIFTFYTFMNDFSCFHYTFMKDFCWECYIFMNDFLSYNKIRGEILKTIIDNYL